MAFLKRLGFGSFFSDLPDVYDKDEIDRKEEAIENTFNNYYTKEQVYTQAQVESLISQIETGGYEEVTELPTVGDPNVIYLIPKQGGGYERWIYSNGQWKDLGDTSIDMTQYVHKNEIADMIHPVGDTVIRTDNVNPGTLYTGTTWQKISEGKVLIGANSAYPLGSSANGSMKHNHSNPNTGGSSEANTGGPSNNTSGGTVLTANQSGLRSHRHEFKTGSGQSYSALAGVTGSDFSTNTTKRALPAANNNGVHFLYQGSGTLGILEFDGVSPVDATGATEAHTHTLSSHTHGMEHYHSQGNTGDATIPYLAVNIWIRTA